MYTFHGKFSFGQEEITDHNRRTVSLFGYKLQFDGSKQVYYISVSGDVYFAHYDSGMVRDIEEYGTRTWLRRVMFDLGVEIPWLDRNSVRMS